MPEGALEWIRSQWDRGVEACEAMAGGAGRRRYWRVSAPGRRSIVFMWARSEDPAILPPALRRAVDGIPFLEVGEFLAGAGIPVPRVHASDVPRRFVLVEDLGSRHLGDLRGDALEDAYASAIELLARTHALCPPTRNGDIPLPFRRSFDAEWIRFELDLFLGLGWSEAVRGQLVAELDRLIDHVARLPRVLCLRDYQSQNLMLDPDGRLRVLDFQDALLAPAALDLAALLWDSYLPMEPSSRRRLLEHYGERAPRAVPPEELALLTVQRKCKDLSRFQRLIERGDARYAQARERAAQAIRENVAQLPAELASLERALCAALPEIGV